MAYARDLRSEADFVTVLAAAKEGQDWAWSEIYVELAGALTGYLRSRGAHDPDASASETFLHVARNIRSFEGDKEAFRSWVFVIAHRRMIDARRSQSRRPKITDDDRLVLQVPSLQDAEDEAIQLVIAAEMRRAFDELTNDQRDVLALRIIADLSLEQTAEVLGKGVGAVKALQRRGLAALRRSTQASEVSK